MSRPDPDDPVAPYVALLEGLSPARLDALKAILAPEVRFSDPFNDVTGPERVVAVFDDMFRRLPDLTFTVTDRCTSRQTDGGHRAYLCWTLRGRARPGGRTWRFAGVSELQFDPAGRLILHRDHWDAAGQLYEKLPLLGPILRALRRRLAG